MAERLRPISCCPGGEEPSGCGDPNWHAWASPFGLVGNSDGNGNAHGFTYDTVGFTAGADRWLTESTVVGFGTGYANEYSRTDQLGSRATVDSFQMAAYLSQRLGDAWVLGMLSYQFDDYHTRRPIDFLATTALGSYAGNQVGSYLEAGYTWSAGGLQVQPIAALQYLSLWRDRFSETGADLLDLNVASAQTSSLRSYLGGRVVWAKAVLPGDCLVPEARAFWVHEYASNSRQISNQFAAGGPGFGIAGVSLGRDFGLVGAGLTMKLGTEVTLGVHYDFYVTPAPTAHGGTAEVGLAW